MVGAWSLPWGGVFLVGEAETEPPYSPTAAVWGGFFVWWLAAGDAP